MQELTQHFWRMLFGGRVAHIEIDDRIGQIALLQFVVVRHISSNLLDKRKQHRLLQRTRIEHGRIVSVFECELDELQVIRNECLMEGYVHAALGQQCFDLCLHLEGAGRWSLSLRPNGAQHRVFDGGRLGFESFANLIEDSKIRFQMKQFLFQLLPPL